MSDTLGNGIQKKQPQIAYTGNMDAPEVVSDQSSKLSWKNTTGKSGETHQVDATQTSQQKANEHHKAND